MIEDFDFEEIISIIQSSHTYKEILEGKLCTDI